MPELPQRRDGRRENNEERPRGCERGDPFCGYGLASQTRVPSLLLTICDGQDVRLSCVS